MRLDWYNRNVLLTPLFPFPILIAQGKPEAPVTAPSIDPIQPDRPDLTDSTYITPKGKWLLETGYRQSSSSTGTVHLWGDSPVLRFGFNSNFEFRFGLPTNAATADGSGATDSSIGFKWQFSKMAPHNPSLGFEFSTTFPSGDGLFRVNTLQPVATGLVSFDLGNGEELDFNLGAGLLQGDSRQFTQWTASTSFQHPLTEKTQLFFEWYSYLPSELYGTNTNFIDFGFTHRLTSELQVDAFVGHGLNGEGHETLLGGGVSIRF